MKNDDFFWMKENHFFFFEYKDRGTMEERLQKILHAALQYQVSDIHFALDSVNDAVTIDMRSSTGMKRLKHHAQDASLFRYLMYRANLDLSNAFLPQTGSFEMEIDKQLISLRFAVVNSYHITSGVLRILNNHPILSIEELSQQEDVQQWLTNITNHKSGLFLLSGPTSSGKTTSLYTILSKVPNKKIFSIEDPVEIQTPGIIQLQVNESQHLSYGEGIKQLMRHDPDVLMIGEIRDEEAAQMAIRCALTGHLVLSSIHSTDCATAILRMQDFGVKDYELKDVLSGISNQRLYEQQDGKYIGVYEIMNRKEVIYYLEHRKTSENFRNLQTRIQEQVDSGNISKEQAEADLFA